MSHSHPHPHEHPHEHDHAHHGIAPRSRPDLSRGEGAGKLLFLDAPSGLAGDMVIAALVDLGVPEAVITGAVAQIPIAGFHIHFGVRSRSGIVGTSFDVHVEDAQPERTFGAIRALLSGSTLEPAVQRRALLTFEKLARAEAKVHRAPVDEVHFHEVGAVDAIVDVVGSAAALEWIGAHVVVSPLPMGRGFVRARHGVLPLPPPAVVECLAGFETYDAGIDFELVTPTGAAIVAAHAERSERWPRMAPERVGWGAGTADLADRANLLRVVLGAAPVEAASYVVLEANVDDATGELVGAALETLREEGAVDAWATPVMMKKGRPGLIVSVLTPVAREGAVAAAILRETTSIGVRRTLVSRVERPRRTVTVETRFGPIPVKVSEGPYGPAQQKPEFDACQAAARAHGVPVREVLQAAIAAIESSPDR